MVITRQPLKSQWLNSRKVYFLLTSQSSVVWVGRGELWGSLGFFGDQGPFHLVAGPSSGISRFSLLIWKMGDREQELHTGDIHQPVLEEAPIISSPVLWTTTQSCGST